ncbi:MAG: FtsK/SpoIIIE domain-containing protein, partial [Anaerolineae bacterium]
MSLLEKIVLRIFDTTGLLPVNAVAGCQGNYQIHEYIVTPFLFVITLNPLRTSTKDFTNDRLMADLKLVADLEASETVAIDVHRGFVCIQIPRPAEERGKLVLTSANVPRGSGLRVPLGLDILNMPVDFNFANEMSTNLSFLGVPGSGKSVAMRRSIVSLARNNAPSEVKFLLIEVAKDGLDLRIFGRLPHLVHPVITDPAEAAAALKFLVESINLGKL